MVHPDSKDEWCTHRTCEWLTVYQDTDLRGNLSTTSIVINNDTASNVPLDIYGTSGQSTHLTRWLDSDNNVLANVTKHGKIQSTKGFRGEANQGGDSFGGWSYGRFVPEHTISNSAGSYDYTGSAYGEHCVTDLTNTPFTQQDADHHNFLVISGGPYAGAKTFITDYISSATVLIEGGSLKADMADINYKIYPPPDVWFGDGANLHMFIPPGGHFHVLNSEGSYTGRVLAEFENECGDDNVDTVHISHDAYGHCNCDAMQIFYSTGTTPTNCQNQVLQISIDETLASDGEIDGLLVESTAVSAATRNGIRVGTGFTNALSVSGAEREDMDYGYEVTAAHTPTDRVNGGAGDGNAFLEAGNDLELFDNDNEYILIGHSTMFEVLECILANGSSKNIEAVFEYSTGNGTWTTLIVDDGTQGFTTSGLIDWSAPLDWAVSNKADGTTGDITSAYYIRITRTYTPTISNLPTENYFKIYCEQAGDTGMKITGQGVIKLPYLTAIPSSPENGMIWMEADGLHLYYNDGEKTVAGA